MLSIVAPIATAQPPDSRPGAAQPGDLIQTRRWFQGPGAGQDIPMLIETSAPIANLLTRAEDGIARRDWKLAIDSLQRVIDDRLGTLVPRDDGAMEGGVLFESAKRLAIRRLSSLPPEGLLAYRILFDGKAKGLFERAKNENDPVALRAVADRFLLTRYGDDAADRLASRALDEGRLSVVVALLNDVLVLVPDHDVPLELIYGKLAVAYRLMGYPDRAAKIAEEYESQAADKATPADRHSPFVSDRLDDVWVRRTHELLAELRAPDDGGLRAARVGPPVNPSLIDHVPWRYDLEGAAADLWRRIINDDPGVPPPIPRTNAVSDAERLYVRIPGGCAALDIDDLSAVWRSSTDAAFRPAAAQQQAVNRRMAAPTTPVAPVGPYSDDPSNVVSTAHGLVFAIERSGAGEFADRDEVGGRRFLFLRQPNRNFRGIANGTRLVAYDSRSGAVRWQRGRTDNTRDLLGDVRFLSTPIAVGDAVWVPYLQGGDFYVGVLRPGDGAVLQTILLGSLREPPELGEPTTPPTLADGVVYIPTGYGSLYAVDADSMSLRWAACYDAQANTGRRPPTAAAPRFWLPSPPVVSGGAVLLTPTDFAELIVFDAVTGEYRWSDTADGCSYLIASDGGRVWLGGRRITCRRLTDGQTLWTTHLIGVPTGKAVVCGDVVHVPTSGGLVSLDAMSGDILGEKHVPAFQPPLGNLACLNTGLYSLDPSSLRRFPDVERMHDAASALLAADPKNATAAVQLAWAEILQDRPQRAYDVVATLPEQLLGENGKIRSAVARVKVEAILALAKQAASPNEALSLLRQADEAALSAATRLRCRSAIADQQAALGRIPDAYRGLLAAGLNADAGELIELDDGVSAVARLEIGGRLHQLRDRMTADELRKIESEAGQWIDSLVRRLREESEPRSARDELLALADLHRASPIGQRALFELADWEADQRLFERAEQRLDQCIRDNADPAWTAAATMRLCELYADPDEGAYGLLVKRLDELEARFGLTPLSAVPGRVGGGRLTASPSSGSIADWAAKMRLRIPIGKLPARLAEMYGEAPTPGPAFSLAGRYAWTYDAPEEADPARFVIFDAVPPRAIIDRIVVAGREGFLECVSADRKELLWRTRLHPPGVFADTPDIGQRNSSLPRFGVADGQTAVVNGPEGIFAVGLLTGRLLWARPFDRPVMDVAGISARDRMMAARDGLLAAMPGDGRLTLMRLADGSTIWERDLRGESVSRIWLHEKSVVFADSAMKRVHILDRENGRLIKQILVRQPDPEHELVDLVQTGGMLYGPDSSGPGDGVAAFDLQRGKLRWRVGVDKPIIALFEPKAGYLGIGLLGGDLRIVNAATGEIVLERGDPNVRAVVGGVMWDGTLILRCAGSRGPLQGNELAAFDIATGAEVWRRRDVTLLMPGDAPLTVIGGVIPAVVEQSRTEVSRDGAATPRGAPAVTLIDARTGTDSGAAVDLAAALQGVTLNGDLAFWPNVVVIGTIKGVHAVRVDPVDSAPGRDF